MEGSLWSKHSTASSEQVSAVGWGLTLLSCPPPPPPTHTQTAWPG